MLTWFFVGGSSPPLVLDSFAAPAAGASSCSGSAAIYGPWMGRGGLQHQLPPHRRIGREKRGGRAIAWEGATEWGGKAVGGTQRQDPHRHSDTHLPCATPTPRTKEGLSAVMRAQSPG